jgi:ATP-binding cassette subfamily B protein
VHWVLNAAYRQAVQWEMVVSAPTAKLKLPRIRRREMQVLSIEQSKAFIKVALPTLYGTLETVAIVGLNGSGKSTIGLLATRLYQPESGAIFLGRQDIREISLRGLRSIVTLVPQDPVLFDETVRENLLYGKPSATDGDLDKVAAQTQLDQVLQKLPAGLDEPLGPLGNRLSGGEKKRVALARTLLQTPNVLILDEITSALDEPAARDLLHGLDLFRKARTLIIISHRPTTILWADRILVIGEGAVVDSGTHAQLISRCALYQRIWKSQDIYSNSTHTL